MIDRQQLRSDLQALLFIGLISVRLAQISVPQYSSCTEKLK